jgi:hypothetical protein
MSAQIQSGTKIVDSHVAGSVYPRSEQEMLSTVLLDGSTQQVYVEGSLYGRSIEMRGDVTVIGPIVVRGDTRLNPGSGRIFLASGLTVNGSVNGTMELIDQSHSTLHDIQNAGLIVKGDVCVNQNIALKNAIVFGSIRAANCSLENSVVLGTCVVAEQLKVSASSIGGYASREVTFAGPCTMLHALGESRTQPLFVPYEAADGSVLASDVRYYPAIRGAKSLINRSENKKSVYPEYSQLISTSDWLQIQASANSALDEQTDSALTKWVLSIGGRIGDFSKIAHAIACLTKMLKCGFEYEHYHLKRRAQILQAALNDLTDEEQWILKMVCR